MDTRESRDADFSRLATKTDLDDFKTELFKWLVTMLLGPAALITALVKLL